MLAPVMGKKACSKDLSEVMSGAFTSAAAGTDFSGTEPNGLARVCLTLQGTRKVVTMDLMQIRAFLTELDGKTYGSEWTMDSLSKRVLASKLLEAFAHASPPLRILRADQFGEPRLELRRRRSVGGVPHGHERREARSGARREARRGGIEGIRLVGVGRHRDQPRRSRVRADGGHHHFPRLFTAGRRACNGSGLLGQEKERGVARGKEAGVRRC